MSDKLKSPVGYCGKCGAVYYRASSFNERCSQILNNGKRCTGAIESRMVPGDWTECPTCATSGRTDEGRCPDCDGKGWHESRGR